MSNYCHHCMSPLDEMGGVCPACGKVSTCAVPAHHLLPGTMLNNKFYVGRALGEGGFGITYIGRDTKLDIKVAIKEFYPNGYVNRSNTTSPQVNDSVSEGRRDFFEKGRERFLKEAQILAKFSGEPGVVDVRDFFEENNTAYIIMEYLDGEDLKTYLKKAGPLTADETIRLLLPVMNSLKKVHAQGLIHRDISPDNIMIVGDKVKLLDFGAARTMSAAANKSLSVMLKPGYAPEEQYRSKGEQGPWTDIYALCATMYKCITGITPDDATQRVFSDEVKTPSALNISIQPEMERAIMRGMSVHQHDRYQSIEDLIRGLQGIEVAVPSGDRTMPVGVAEQEERTVYVPQVPGNADIPADDDRTVLGTDPVPVEPVVPVVPVQPQVTYNQVQAVYAPPQTPQPAEKKSKLGLWLAIGAAVVAMIVLLVVLLAGGDDPAYDEDDLIFGQHTTEDDLVVWDTTTTQEDSDDHIHDDIVVVDTTKTPTETTEKTTEKTTKKTTAGKVTMSNDLFDFTFKLDGVVYQLPCSYQSFTKNGWTISSNGTTGDTKLEANTYAYFTMANEGRTITVYSFNGSGNTKKLKDCSISGIECTSKSGVDFEIASKITPDSSVAAIKKAFGTPSKENNYDNYDSLRYVPEEAASYNIGVDFVCSKNNFSSSISMKNFVKTEDDKTETNTKAPSYLKEYKAPKKLGKDLKSAVIELEGDLYQFPAPVSEFIKNGWTITSKEGDVVSGGDSSIKMKKGGKDLYFYVTNFAEYQTTPENCAVTRVYVYETDEMEVAIGAADHPVKLGMAKSAVSALISSDFSVYDTSYSYSEFRERDFYVSISFDDKSGKVSSISFSCKTWDY